MDPALTYGRAKLPERPRFIPHYVQYERKCLRLEAYFKQGIFGSADESFRVRKVRLLYYLEDDTLAVFEPRLDNVGFNQGKLVRRSKVPKPDEPNCYYHWKDLNIAINIGETIVHDEVHSKSRTSLSRRKVHVVIIDFGRLSYKNRASVYVSIKILY